MADAQVRRRSALPAPGGKDMRLLYAAAFAVLLAARMTPAFAACVNAQCTDTAAIERARATIQATCGCTRAGQTHGKYAKCVKSTLKLADLTALIPQKACRKLIRRCENASICGKPNAAVCCIAKANGKVKSSIVGNSAKCKKGNACSASLGFFSKFDPRPADGTPPGPPTTTTTTTVSTTSTTSTTSSTTTVPISTTTTTTTAVCGDGVRQASEECDGGDLGGNTCPCPDDPNTVSCNADCTVDFSRCRTDCCCEPSRIVTTSSNVGGSLVVGTFAAFPFPGGVVTTVDAGAADIATCKHSVTVPGGGFTVPVFCIPALQYSSQVVAQGCEGGTADGQGSVWDASAASPTPNVTSVGDSSDGVCNPAGQPCNVAAGGAGNNTLGDINTVRGGPPAVASGQVQTPTRTPALAT